MSEGFCSVFSSGIGGNIRARPESVFIVVATRKKINSKKEMSAIEPAFTSCIFLLFPAIIALMSNCYLIAALTSANTAESNAAAIAI